MEQLFAMGRFIGKGNTAEVYHHEAQQVVKLYAEKFGLELALYEQGVLSALNSAGAPSPLVGDIVKVGNRFGLKMEFVDGQTMDRLLVASPGRITGYSRLMASLHARIHTITIEALQDQQTALSDRINNNISLLGGFAAAVLAYLKKLPAGNVACHGDFHPKNVLAGADKNTVIDWTNAYRGNPLSDLTLTRLRLMSPYVPTGFTGDANLFITAKKAIYEAYMEEYTRLTGIVEADTEPWLLPCAAAQLHALKTVHTAWLLDIIGKQIKKSGL